MRFNLLLPAVVLSTVGSGRASAVFSMTPDWTYNITGMQTNLRIVAACLDEDSIPDLIVGNVNKETLTVFYGVGDGTFTLGEEHSSICPNWIESADIDEDGNIDVLVRTINQTDTLSLYFNSGTGLLENPIKISGPGGHLEGVFLIRDINSDTHLDLITFGWLMESVYAMLGDGTGGFVTELLFTEDDVAFMGIECGDIDNDSDNDIVILCWQKFSVWLNNGDGSFSWAGYCCDLDNEASFGTLGFGFLNGDEYVDIASTPGAGYGTYSVFSFTGDGQGFFEEVGHWVDLGTVLIQTDVSDYNLDGNNDAFFTGYAGSLLMLGDGNGNLTYDYYNDYLPYCFEVAVVDLDLDGDNDYVTASKTFSSPFRLEVFLNKTIQLGIDEAEAGLSAGEPFLAVSENPVASSAGIHFLLPVSSEISLFVLDISGRVAAHIQEGNAIAGEHYANWNTADLPTGCYTVVLRTDHGVVSRRCVRIR